MSTQAALTGSEICNILMYKYYTVFKYVQIRIKKPELKSPGLIMIKNSAYKKNIFIWDFRVNQRYQPQNQYPYHPGHLN